MNQQAVGATEDAVSFTPARRVNQALTASLEKRALQWMVQRAPRWLTSDQLTLLGLIAQIGAGAAYALAYYNRYALLLAGWPLPFKPSSSSSLAGTSIVFLHLG